MQYERNITTPIRKRKRDVAKKRHFIQWRSKGGPEGRGFRAAHSGGQHFANQKLIIERSLKVLVFRYYFKYISLSTAFQFSYLEALDW